MCWLALCGLANAAVCVAAFTVEEFNLRLFGQHLTTPAQKMEGIALYSAISVAGFVYMLWRYHWRYRLSTLLKIAVFWFVAIGAITANAVIAIICIGPAVFVYTVIWACRSK
jgi:hypothetical protein